MRYFENFSGFGFVYKDMPQSELFSIVVPMCDFIRTVYERHVQNFLLKSWFCFSIKTPCIRLTNILFGRNINYLSKL